jgi:hypothetical protein
MSSLSRINRAEMKPAVRRMGILGKSSLLIFKKV